MTEAHSVVGDDAQFRKAIFKIESGSQTGTGFLTQDKQHILTACHVVESIQLKQEVTVRAADTNTTYKASVQKKLQQWDVALLRVEKPIENVPYLNLSPQRVLAAGDKFRTYGFPQEYPPDWHSGTITGELDDGKYSFSFDTGFAYPLEGLSGGPVVSGQPMVGTDDQRYSVVGIMSEHGYDYGFTNNLERGKIVPTSAFYQELLSTLTAEMPRKPDIWCYVVRSEADRNLENSIYSLWQVIEDTMPLLQNVSEDDPQDIVKVIQHPEYVYAADAVSSADNYKEAVEKLCRAKIAIFDITNYEPAAMLLLGIRSVVRRGVTITSIGDKFVIGDPINIPFNIKELSITSHSEEQHKLKGEEPPYLLNKKIRDGLRQLDTLPQYLDMPTFDAVRNLPPKYRAPDEDHVLVLCSYSGKYQEDNWKFLYYRIKLSLEAKKDPKKAPKIYRVLDVMSPRLVSHAIYEAIRSMALCIVDWTEWRPNVFFELGVRLAVTKPTSHTVCIIDKGHKQLVPQINQHIYELKEDNAKADSLIRKLAGVDTENPEEFNEIRDRYLLIAAQCQYLLDLFDPLEYNPPTKNPSIKDLAVYHDIMYYYHSEKELNTSPPQRNGCASSLTYEIIKENIDPGGEITSVPVYLELLKTAQLFGVDSTEARTAVLYPGREPLESSVKRGVLQRLLAAWFFIRSWYEDEQIISEDQLFKNTESIALNLLDLLTEIESNPDNADTGKINVSALKKDVYRTLTSYRRQKEGQS